MNDEEITLEEVIRICSKVHLIDETLSFDSYGTNEVRIDTMEFLYNIGKTLEDAEEVINNLTVNDYFRGPTNHYYINKRVHKLWEFKKVAFNMLIYIKVLPYNKNRCIAVISFHEDR